ncbi:glycosyltransferase family 2 protein [bacterium]|nr:glycosyltransferase family 2 protein [bacterium]
MRVNLVTVCGHNTTMLKHMLQHYKDFVDEIYVVVYLSSDKDRVLSEVKEITNDLNIDIHKTSVEEPFNWERVTQLYNETKLLKPDDWWIVADDDEFHVYPKPVKTIIEECEEYGYRFVTGAFLDRIGEGGRFRNVNEESDIWNLFPLAGSFRLPISNACPNKVPLVKGHVEITNGQHYVRIKGQDTYGDRWKHLYRSPYFIQVHHFKWDMSVTRRLKEVLSIKREYTYHEEYKRMFDYILDNNMKIDITDDRFKIERCGKHFEDYSQWDKIKDDAIAYRT